MSRSYRRIVACLLLTLFFASLSLPRQAFAALERPTSLAADAETIRAALLQAQLHLSDDPAAARAALDEAAVAFDADLAAVITAVAPDTAALLHGAFAALETAAADGDVASFASARARIWTAILEAGYLGMTGALARGDGAAARQWLPVREFRHATRFSRPGAEATLAVTRLVDGQATAENALQAVRADLLDTYQARLSQSFADLASADEAGFASRRAELSALAEGYFAILAPAYARQRGPQAADAARLAFAELSMAARSGDSLTAPRAAVAELLNGFRAAPLSPAEQARRGGQALRFLSLVPVEYARGVRNGEVSIDLEIREAITFRDGAEAAFTDLYTVLDARDPAKAAEAAALFAGLKRTLAGAASHSEVAAPSAVRASSEQLVALLQEMMPAEWSRNDTAADFDVISTALDQMETAVAAGEYELAESARLEAYAILESGPEARLVAFAPQYVTPIEDLFWYGQSDPPGLAYLLAQHAPRAAIVASRAALDEQLSLAQQAVGGEAAPMAMAMNAAIIVFREGLEAVVILAALLGSLVGARGLYRRPIVIGVLMAFAATAVTWWLAQQVLTALSRYGERLEAIVSIIAIAVLLVIMNWFFHRVYWTDWIATLHTRKKSLLSGPGAYLGGQTLGFIMLGFTSVYREGFETVLFLQALVLDAGVLTVLEGVALGMAAVLAIGYLTFKLQTRLPYKRMLVLTGILIGAVLLIMVGNTVHAFQVVGWLPVHPLIGVTLPYWTGLWFGLYATWEGLTLQGAAALFVIGSYYLAERIQKKERAQAVRSASGRSVGPAQSAVNAGR